MVPWQQFLTWPFSTRTRNFFRNACITEVEQLTWMSGRDLLRFRNVGEKTLLEIRQALAHHGLGLRSDVCPPEHFEGDLLTLQEEQVILERRLREIAATIKYLEALERQTPGVPPAVLRHDLN